MSKYKKRLAKRWWDKLPKSGKAALTRPVLVKQRTI
jgi:hypothetical protein